MTNDYLKGGKDTRPWGTWECIDVGENYIVKKITVNPGQKLSLQYHYFRDEHWTLTKGQAIVTLDDKEIEIKANEHVFIAKEQKHRIENIGTEVVEFIEVQTGEKLSEDDIVRVEDIYNRT